MGARTWTLAVLLLLQIVAGMGNDDPALRDARTPALDPHVADGPETPRESPVAEEGTGYEQDRDRGTNAAVNRAPAAAVLRRHVHSLARSRLSSPPLLRSRAAPR